MPFTKREKNRIKQKIAVTTKKVEERLEHYEKVKKA